jgi:hypothetical protein
MPFLLLLWLAACGAPEMQGGPPDGMTLYESPWSTRSTFACASCHALSETAGDPGGLRRPGHSLAGVLSRPSFKNGQLSRPLDAVNSCLTEWMNADAITQTDPRWTALSSFLADSAPGPATAVPFVNRPSTSPAVTRPAGAARSTRRVASVTVWRAPARREALRCAGRP